MKIIVNTLPESGEDCIFVTSGYRCRFIAGPYSRCRLDCGEKCPYLIEGDRHLKMLAFVSGILSKLSQNGSLTDNEQQQLDNIASELGYFDLDENHFRY